MTIRTAQPGTEARDAGLGRAITGTLACLAVALAAISNAAWAGSKFTVLDGDTLRRGEQSVRLLGIDAPELGQTCKRPSGAVWPCGIAARDALRQLTAAAVVACRPSGEDRYGRTLAACEVGDEDIGRWMVRHGWALAAPGSTYLAEERHARSQKIGVWSGDFERPWRWRARHPRR